MIWSEHMIPLIALGVLLWGANCLRGLAAKGIAAAVVTLAWCLIFVPVMMTLAIIAGVGTVGVLLYQIDRRRRIAMAKIYVSMLKARPSQPNPCEKGDQE